MFLCVCVCIYAHTDTHRHARTRTHTCTHEHKLMMRPGQKPLLKRGWRRRSNNKDDNQTRRTGGEAFLDFFFCDDTFVRVPFWGFILQYIYAHMRTYISYSMYLFTKPRPPCVAACVFVRSCHFSLLLPFFYLLFLLLIALFG